MMRWRKRNNFLGVNLFSGILLIAFVGIRLQAVKQFHTNSDQVVRELVPLNDVTSPEVPFLVDSLCKVKDTTNSLRAFKNQLMALREGEDSVVTIVHLGDSHIQAGFLTTITMHSLQAAFGNAGRGWIAPYKLAKSNEPNDYFIQSSIKDWTVGKCIQAQPKCAYGLGGIGIQTNLADVDFNIYMAPEKGAGYDFNQLLVFRHKNSNLLEAVGANCEYVTVCSDSLAQVQLMIDTLRVDKLINGLQLNGIGKADNANNIYYGFMLTNGNPWILYHTIGNNGAMFVNYTNREYMEQLATLKPSLLIVSMGTNESVGARFREDNFTSQLDQFIRLVKEYMPETALLLTTPAECYVRKRVNKKRVFVRNKNIETIAKSINNYAAKEGLACFDLYQMTGGANSCEQWYKNQMMGKDRIHFSKEGYAAQGKLLYKALVRMVLDDNKEEM